MQTVKENEGSFNKKSSSSTLSHKKEQHQCIGGISYQMDEGHWMCTFVMDRGETERKMLRYDIKKLVSVGGILSMFCSGTVFTMDSQLTKSIIIYIGIMSGIFVLMVITMTEDDLADYDTDSLEKLTGFINGFVPFVLALYISLVLTRWWNLRTQALGAIFNAVSNTMLIVSASLPGDEWAKLRSEVVRLGMASILLVVQAARKDWDIQHFVKEGILDEEELKVCEETELFQRASMMWVWILRICGEGFDAAKLPPPRYNAIMGKAMQARDGVQTIHTYLDTQLPFSYVHLITLLVNLQNIVFACKCGVVSAVAYSSGESQQVAVQFLMCGLVIVIYQGLLICSYIIHDPFGEDLLDFPVIAYTEYLSWTCNAMQRGANRCPALRPEKREALVGHMAQKAVESPDPKVKSPDAKVKPAKTKAPATPEATSPSSASASVDKEEKKEKKHNHSSHGARVPYSSIVSEVNHSPRRAEGEAVGLIEKDELTTAVKALASELQSRGAKTTLIKVQTATRSITWEFEQGRNSMGQNESLKKLGNGGTGKSGKRGKDNSEGSSRDHHGHHHHGHKHEHGHHHHGHKHHHWNEEFEASSDSCGDEDDDDDEDDDALGDAVAFL